MAQAKPIRSISFSGQKHWFRDGHNIIVVAKLLEYKHESIVVIPVPHSEPD